MIALDTNILVRYIVGDHPAHSALASSLIETELSPQTPGFVSMVVIAELSWVLRRRYGVSAETVTTIVQTLLTSPQIAIENRDAVGRALTAPRDDLADALIHEVGRAAGCEKTITFDRKFARTPGVELLGQNAGPM